MTENGRQNPGDPPEAVERLVEDLAADGVAIDEGAFSLDRERARAQMDRYLLPEPERYVLELVQAAVLKGATTIAIEADTNDVRLLFDGDPFDRADFDDLYNSLLSGRRDPIARARQQLALGVVAALSLDPKYVRITSSTDDGGIQLELRPGEPDVVKAAAPPSATAEVPEARAEIHVRSPIHVEAALREWRGLNPVEHLLRERCRFARQEIYLDGRRISSGLRIQDETGGICEFESDGVHGVAGLVHQGSGRRVDLVVDGVFISTHELDRGPPGLCAMLESSALRKDISQADIVKDDAYQSVLDALFEALPRALRKLCRQEHPADLERSGWGKAILRHTLGTWTQRAAFEGGDELATSLAQVDAWPTRDRERDWVTETRTTMALSGRGRLLRRRHGVWRELDGAPIPPGEMVLDETGLLYRRQGDGWIDLDGPWTNGQVTCLWHTDGQVLLGTKTGELFQGPDDGTDWKTIRTGTSARISGIWGDFPNLYIVGKSGSVLRYDGAIFTEIYSDGERWLRDIWGTSPNDLYVVGDSGTFLHFDGNSWSEPGANTIFGDLRSVYVRAPYEVFLVGDGVYWYDGHEIHRENAPGDRYRAVRETHRGDLVAAGRDHLVRRNKRGVARSRRGPTSLKEILDAHDRGIPVHWELVGEDSPRNALELRISNEDGDFLSRLLGPESAAKNR